MLTVEERRRQEKRRRYLHATVGPLRVPVDVARDHVEALRASGMSVKGIARAAGVAASTVHELRRQSTVMRSTQERLLAVPVPAVPTDARWRFVSVGGVRRLQALCAIGWTLPRLAPEVGVSAQGLYRVVREEGRMSAATYRGICAAYDRLWSSPPVVGPRQAYLVEQARLRAAEQGWAPPLAWDDATIDDPASRPFGVRGWAFGSAWSLADLEEALAVGRSVEEVLEGLGVERESVRRRCARAGRRDLLERLGFVVRKSA